VTGDGEIYPDGDDSGVLCGCPTAGPFDPICPSCERWRPMGGERLPAFAVECDCGAVSPVGR
jgi:hypothetical protein